MNGDGDTRVAIGTLDISRYVGSEVVENPSKYPPEGKGQGPASGIKHLYVLWQELIRCQDFSLDAFMN